MSPVRGRPSLWAAVARSLILVGVVGGAALLGVGGWVGAGDVHDAFFVPRVEEPPVQARVSALGERTIALESVAPQPRYLTRDGAWAVENEFNVGVLGALQDHSVNSALRGVELLGGSAFDEGALVSIHPWAYGPDPTLGLNLVYDELSLDSELGPLGGWFIDGDRTTWALVLRDSAEERRSTLRVVSELHELGTSVVMLDYRNQGTSPLDPSGAYQYGATEWRDVEVAVEYASAEGAQDIFLFGTGMGGSAAIAFLNNSRLADEVAGVVVEGPHLDARASVAAELATSKLPLLDVPSPVILQNATLSLTEWRYGIDWAAMNHLSATDRLSTPVLVIVGGRDTEAPSEPIATFAEAAPDSVRIERFEEAGHGEAWNVDRPRYRALISEFVDTYAG